MTRLSILIHSYNREKLQPGEPAMTQRRLAELTGQNEATVSRHVNGATTMSLAQGIAYARVLQCRIEDLYAEPERKAS